MDFLPINLISEEDGFLVDNELIELAKLQRLGFPVVSGIVVFPPEKKDLNFLPIELAKELSKKSKNPKKVWNDLVLGWSKSLKAQPVFFVEKVLSSGRAFFNKEKGEVVIQIEAGNLNPGQKSVLSELILGIEKKVLFTMTYHWIYEGSGVKFIRITPFEHHIARSINNGFGLEKSAKLLSPVKAFVKQDNFVLAKDADGIIFLPEPKLLFDEEVSRLVETAITVYPNPVIVKLLNPEDFKMILFGRNLKQLLNIQVCIPNQKNVGDFLEIKRQLMTLGISRKGSMKFWLEIATSGNFLEIEEFIEGGLDGLIMNLDVLNEQLKIPKGSEGQLLRFLERPLKVAERANIPVIIDYDENEDDYFLDVLKTKGVWGMVKNQEKRNDSPVIAGFQFV